RPLRRTSSPRVPGTLRRFRWLAAIAVAVVLVLVTYPFWLTAMAGYLVRSDPAVPADMVVVLAGDFTGNRIFTAGDLVRQGFASKALVSGPAGIYDHYESELAINLAGQKGYPA